MKNLLIFLLIASLELFAQTPEGNFILKKVYRIRQ